MPEDMENIPATAYRVLLHLYAKDKRFSDIAKHVPKATVAKILPELEAYKYIERIVSTTRPIHVTYRITEKGKTFVQNELERELYNVIKSVFVMSEVNQKTVLDALDKVKEQIVIQQKKSSK
jgi:DNA-binding HxlR family transcriptional regulator